MAEERTRNEHWAPACDDVSFLGNHVRFCCGHAAHGSGDKAHPEGETTLKNEVVVLQIQSLNGLFVGQEHRVCLHDIALKTVTASYCGGLKDRAVAAAAGAMTVMVVQVIHKECAARAVEAKEVIFAHDGEQAKEEGVWEEEEVALPRWSRRM